MLKVGKEERENLKGKTGLMSDRMFVLLRVCGVLLLNDQNLKNAALFLFQHWSF